MDRWVDTSIMIVKHSLELNWLQQKNKPPLLASRKPPGRVYTHGRTVYRPGQSTHRSYFFSLNWSINSIQTLLDFPASWLKWTYNFCISNCTNGVFPNILWELEMTVLVTVQIGDTWFPSYAKFWENCATTSARVWYFETFSNILTLQS